MSRPRRQELHPRLLDYRRRAGLTQEQVAERLGISVEMVRRHEKGLAQPVELYRVRYSALFRASQRQLGLLPAPAGGLHPTATDIDSFLAEIVDTGTADESISRLDEATTALADTHTQAPARQVLAQVMRVHREARTLAARRQRLSQTRELYRIESELLSHACLLFGDLGQNVTAEKYGVASLSLAQEAGSATAIPRTALAKTLRWSGRLIESASMARAGYEQSPAGPIRVQLASQEANAAALLGDVSRAREALSRATNATNHESADGGTSAWSFPTARQAIFALSVATKTGDPDEALRAAKMADEAWGSGAPLVTANWAQIRLGSAVAYLLKDSLEAAAAEVAPVLSLRPELRVSTVTGYMEDLDQRLRKPSLRKVETAVALRDSIRTFNEEAKAANTDVLAS